jgi:hypothetical protein
MRKRIAGGARIAEPSPVITTRREVPVFLMPTAEDSRNGEELVRLTRLFVERELEAWPEFRAALIVGSIAHAENRVDSDVDCIFVFDQLDERVVPAEFVWVPQTGSYHTIFEVEAADVGGVQIDAWRVSTAEFRSGEWDEGLRHDLAAAIVIADRGGMTSQLLRERLQYPDALRQSRVAEHFGRAGYYAEEWRVQEWIGRGGLEGAHDQLTAAFEEILKLLHAYHRVWLPWRYRWLVSARKLAWLPDGYHDSVQTILTGALPSQECLMQRRAAVMRLLDAIGVRLRTEGLVAEPDEAFRATHPGLGYRHNMEAWRQGHRELLEERGGRR